jgi:hypothetical protein
MWEVIATSSNGKVRTKIVSNWRHGMHLASLAMEMEWKVSIVPVYVDLFVIAEDGALLSVVSRVRPQLAAKFVKQWVKTDKNHSGCSLSLVFPLR